MTPPISAMCPARVAYCAVRGMPSSSLPVRGMFPPTTPSPSGHAWGARVSAQGVPPLLRPLAACWGCPLPSRGDLLYPLAAHGGRALLCDAPPPPVSARVKRALPFGGSSLHSTGWPHARSARCLSCSPVLVSLPLVSPVPVVSSGSPPFPWGS